MTFSRRLWGSGVGWDQTVWVFDLLSVWWILGHDLGGDVLRWWWFACLGW